jgi:hypothetical protein
MIEYYLRTDGAYVKIDTENKIITNVLAEENHKFIGNNSNVSYVDNIISLVSNFKVSNEEDFNNALQTAKSFINNI